MQSERINKVLSRAGVASRREAERLLKEGFVTINGQTVFDPHAHMDVDASLRLRGKQIVYSARNPIQKIWAFHKPDGFLVTRDDPGNRPTIYDILSDSFVRIKTIGRLDFHTEGLLLLTNDGELAQTFERPENGYRRVYKVRAYGIATPERLRQLRNGLRIGSQRFGSIKVEVEGGRALKYPRHAWYRVVLHEGKYREVRHVFAYLGLTVRRLIRVAYGPYSLGNLPLGKWRVLK